MKKITLSLMLLFLSGAISLQATRLRLLGSASQQPVELANVCMLDSDSVMIAATLSDSLGYFNIPENDRVRYYRITAVGYNELYQPSASLSDGDSIYLQESARDLSEVIVKGRRSPYTVQPDRIIFNPEFAAFATSAYDIVSSAPGVIESDGTVSMPSKQGVKILINGKEQRGDLKDVMRLLKSYQAADIKSVEVISAPSAKYTRGADIGAINVILKKRASDYLGGSASYTMGVSNRVTNNLSAGLNYRTDRLSASFNAFGSLIPYAFRESNSLHYDDITRMMKSDGSGRNNGLTLKASIDYTLSPKWDVAFNYFLGISDTRYNAKHHYDYLDRQSIFDTRDVWNHRDERSTSHYLYAETNGRLSDKASLNASIDYYRKAYPSSRNEENVVGEWLMRQDNDMRSSNLTAHATLDLAISQALRLNFGADYLYTQTDTESGYSFNPEGSFGNTFDYKENELDLYAQLQYSFAMKWFLSANMRYEYLSAKSKVAQEEVSRFSRDRSDFIPSVFLSYTLNQKNSFRLSYYYNTNKPSISSLNPMVLYLGNGTYRTGNPELKDSRHFLLSLTYNLGSLSIEPYYEWLSDGISQTGRVEQNGELVYSWNNATNVRTGGLMVFWAWSGLSWMNFSATQLLTYHHVFSSDKTVPFDSHNLKYTAYPRVQFFLDRERKFVFSVNGSYATKDRKPDFVMNPVWKLSAALLWRPTQQWTISLSGDNLLCSHTGGYQRMTGSRLDFNNKYTYPGVSLTASFVWGKSGKFRRENSTRRDLDERTRLIN
ncbi:MAG: TonB-dependent receptor [Bacteroides sp.]|nr:TonB-dependent receptor [Bacteroides sp.]